MHNLERLRCQTEVNADVPMQLDDKQSRKCKIRNYYLKAQTRIDWSELNSEVAYLKRLSGQTKTNADVPILCTLLQWMLVYFLPVPHLQPAVKGYEVDLSIKRVFFTIFLFLQTRQDSQAQCGWFDSENRDPC